jgi:hypothetical protein
LKPLLFPTDQPVMPEFRQIGRAGAIAGLELRLAEPAHQWLVGPRRIGKTSVAKAVLARLRKGGSIALDVDLSKLPALDQANLAGDLARQAQAADAGRPSDRVQRLSRRLRRQAAQGAGLGQTLSRLGFASDGEALAAVAALLAGADGGEPGLGAVLASLALHARATEGRTYLLLDEVQLLAEVADAARQVARWCHEPGAPIVFLFAGSEESAIAALRHRGEPLAAVGQEFQLPDIGLEDWLAGLGNRFREAGIELHREQIARMVEASGGHPRRTMMIASKLNGHHRQQAAVLTSERIVELAIHDAERDRAWR